MFRAIKRDYATSLYPNSPRAVESTQLYYGAVLGVLNTLGTYDPKGERQRRGGRVERGPPFDVSCICKRRISFNVVGNQEAYEFSVTYI